LHGYIFYICHRMCRVFRIYIFTHLHIYRICRVFRIYIFACLHIYMFYRINRIDRIDI
jgi:hypothetical protein